MSVSPTSDNRNIIELITNFSFNKPPGLSNDYNRELQKKVADLEAVQNIIKETGRTPGDLKSRCWAVLSTTTVLSLVIGSIFAAVILSPLVLSGPPGVAIAMGVLITLGCYSPFLFGGEVKLGFSPNFLNIIKYEYNGISFSLKGEFSKIHEAFTWTPEKFLAQLEQMQVKLSKISPIPPYKVTVECVPPSGHEQIA